MVFDTKYEGLLNTAHRYYCNVSQAEPCRVRLADDAGGKLPTPEERLADARYLESLGYLDMVFLDGNKLYFRLTQKGLEHCEPTAKQPPATFQIGTVNNSVVGNQQNVTMNVGASFEEIRAYIESRAEIPTADRKQLQELTDAVETMLKQNQSIARGSLKQHANLFERYGPIVGAVVGQLVGFLLKG